MENILNVFKTNQFKGIACIIMACAFVPAMIVLLCGHFLTALKVFITINVLCDFVTTMILLAIYFFGRYNTDTTIEEYYR